MENDTKNKILIVDDDSFLLNMYSQKFIKKGFEVVTSTNSEEALKHLRGGLVVDIMMLDIIMPGIDGIALLETIKKENLSPDATIIMLTNQGGSSEIDKAKQLGVNGYIVKATTIPSEVVEEVTQIFEKSKK